MVNTVKNGDSDAGLILKSLNENVYGYDIQPVAILITKLQLLLVSLPLMKILDTTSENIYKLLPYKNIKLIDPLSNPQNHWGIFAKFDLVVGNPPYLKINMSNLSSHKEFDEIFAGQPNLYQMFLWWAIKASRPNGTITFLIPQSIRSGQYFGKLRKEISKSCEIKAITCFTASEGVFDSVRQQMMIISLNMINNNVQHEPSNVIIRKSSNGNSLTDLNEIKLSQHHVVFQNDGEVLWCVSDFEIDYQILK